jgi:hypothetical protein
MSIIAVLFLVLNMVIATQFALTKVGYEYYILHPCDTNIRLIGSDNSSDGYRILRVIDSNTTNVGLKLRLGNKFSTNQVTYFSAAFGIVNEENHSLDITHINISSLNNTYIKIWLHGDRDANANSTSNDPSSVFMWDNDTLVNESNTTAWTLAPGNEDPNNMCSNYTNRPSNTIDTGWDETAHVRYSLNNSNAVSNLSDFVWVQIAVDIPATADFIGSHIGTIWIHFKSETGN